MSTAPKKPFDPDMFFRLAGSIVRDPKSDDAELRTAISRAYYAVFLTARDALFGLDEQSSTAELRKIISKKHHLKFGGKPNKPLNSHSRIIFSVLDKTSNYALYQQLDQLKEARVRADYKRDDKCLLEVGKNSWREYAEENMQLAASILPLTKRLTRY